MALKSTGATIKDIKKEWTIAKNGELRFEVDFSETVSIKLLSGTAEVYGMELSPNREYEVRGVKLAIFSYEGARVRLRGKCDVEYTSEETVMHAYLNTHLAIERMRQRAMEMQGDVPRVVVVGQGRATLSKILLNYAVRAGNTPMYVDLDVTNGNLMLPGVLGAQVLEKLIDIDEGGGLGDGQPPYLCFYGSTLPVENPKLYRRSLSRLAFSVNARLAAMNDSRKSGAIICTGADCDDYIAEIQEIFKADMVLVVGNERLHSTISKTLQERNCTVLKLPKSGGFVTKDANFRRNSIQFQYQRYFYGAKQEYSPFSITIPFEEVQIRRWGEDVLAPKSALPLGATRKVDETKAAKVEPTNSNLLYSILAISWANSEDQIYDSNIAGFIYMY